MKAIVWTAYGPPDVLEYREVEKPTLKDDEVLIRIHATTVTAGDCEMRNMHFPLFLSTPMRFYVGFRKPTRIRILGQELAGEIEAVGKDVSRFQPGDQVFAALGLSLGAYAEYICAPAESADGVIALKPDNLTFAEAAAVPVGGLEAIHFLRKANLQRGEKILINGAGGSIGTIGVQLAKLDGAEVTAVDSAAKLDMLRSLGADHVLDYAQEDFTQNGERYDVIFDVIGKSSFSRSMASLRPNGRYVIANPQLSKMLRGLIASATGSKKVIFEPSHREAADLEALKALIESGKLKPVIDRTYPLAQTADAHRYVETGQKAGNVVIMVRDGLEN
ncbi:MAG: NAD(P)-dependent alcohol dehydrogenase [Caldilineales bacterium]|nr:NAD(P)-dependent alcohol dehydrogenase [Caldilineales bacterium]